MLVGKTAWLSRTGQSVVLQCVFFIGLLFRGAEWERGWRMLEILDRLIELTVE